LKTYYAEALKKAKEKQNRERESIIVDRDLQKQLWIERATIARFSIIIIGKCATRRFCTGL
jgi:hypothetical protein